MVTIMLPKGVLVVNSPSSSRGTIQGSGILFEEGWVLAHGSILGNFFKTSAEKSWVTSFLKYIPSEIEASKYVDSNISFNVYEEVHLERRYSKLSTEDSKKITSSSICYSAQLIYAWKCPLISKSLPIYCFNWTLGDTLPDAQLSDTDKIVSMEQLMPIFLLLRIKQPNRSSMSQKFKTLMPNISSILFEMSTALRGQDVLIESTPYGNAFFLNSWSRGIVSNVFGYGECMFLTDARSVICCEGAPIFTFDRSQVPEKRVLFGMVGCSLSWARGEWVGLTIGINLRPVLRRLLRDPSTLSLRSIIDKNFPSHVLDLIDECIVLIRCGGLWGSGIVVDSSKGIIITCSHVFKSVSPNEEIFVFHKGSTYTARLIYRTKDGLAYDIAVLEIHNHRFSQHFEFSDESARTGETVVAVGFPLISEREDRSLRPTLVQGSVSRSCSAMLQTTCCIQSGSSGGAILKNGKLLGMIVSNARDSANGVLYPHVNFCVPASAFQQSVMSYVSTGKETVLYNLESSDSKVQEIWKLRCSLSKL